MVLGNEESGRRFERKGIMKRIGQAMMMVPFMMQVKVFLSRFNDP